MVFWTLRLCVDVFPEPSGLIHVLTLWNILWNICTHSSRCFVSAVTLSCFVNSLCLPAVGTALLCSRVLGSLPWLFVNGFSGSNPWLFYFLHGHLARVSSTKSNDFRCPLLLRNHCCSSLHRTSSILRSRASITHRPLVTIEVAIFTQLESSITLSMY